jgi:hypothetical protein
LKLHRLVQQIAAISLPAVLVACGGGGDSATTPATPATPSSLKISGTAAVGAAMANASITLSCATGSATPTADANGVYTATITGGALPCVLTATSSDGLTVLHSVAAGSGTADTTVNITPLTELLLAQLAGADPQAYVASFTSGTVITSSDIAAAQTALLQNLSAAGMDISAVTDVVSGTLTAGSHAGYDDVLDKLQATIDASGTTLTEVAQAVATSSTAGTSTSASTLTTVLAPSSTDCAGLKTGAMRVLNFADGTDALVQVDASAMTATMAGSTYTLGKNASCDYTLNDAAATRVLVARSGVAVLLQGSGTSGVVAVAIPEQTLDVAALAGTYDRVQYGSTFDTESGDFGTTVFAADGQNGLSVNCPLGVGNCVEDTQSKGKLVANAAGGFDYVENGASEGRIFAFRNASGRTIMVGHSPDGTAAVLAQQAALSLPAVGAVSSYWQFTVNGNGLGAVSSESNTIMTVDTAAGSVTRQFASDSHFDTLGFDTPFQGARYRATNACTTSTGGAFSCNGVVQLPLGGLVLSVSSVPAKHFMTVSINQP